MSCAGTLAHVRGADGMTWIHRSATELAGAIAAGEVSSEEVVRAHLARIDAVNPRLNAVVARLDDEALADARRADAEVARGTRRGPLHGVPVTLKESLAMAGKVTSCGSTRLQRNVTPEDATAVARLKQAGAIPIARTNVPDMGMDAQTHNLVWGITRNPWDLARTPGGSSGGEGAAIASGMSPLGLGSDVGGSIRIPAAFCGILGLKPTQHRVSIAGHVPLTLHDFLQIGPLARAVDDLEVALAAIAGPDGKQSMVPPVPLRDTRGQVATNLRVGVLEGNGTIPVARAVRDGIARAADAAASLGHRVAPASLDHVEDAMVCLSCFFGVALADLVRDVRAHPEAYHPYLSELVEGVPSPSGEEMAEAFRLREDLRARMMTCFEHHDVLICPQATVPAFPIGTTGTVAVDEGEVPLVAVLAYSLLTNATGNPALAIPTGLAGGLPIGIQLVGRMWDESTLFTLARPLLAALGGVPRPPELA
jgi:aspartyl-tRNA(Asn)/glutamyl-tRNA(Gln) amidotransferase subunit A